MGIFYFLVIIVIFSILLTGMLNKKKAIYEGRLIEEPNNIEIKNKLSRIKICLKVILVGEAIISTVGLTIFMRT